MKHFDQLEDLQKTKEARELVEIFLNGVPTMKVAFLLHVSPEYLTFIEVSPEATLDGVTVCKGEDIDSISTDTIYLREFSKFHSLDEVYQQGLQSMSGVKEHTFDGMYAYLEQTAVVTQITTYSEETVTCRIVGRTDNILIFDEYAVENKERIARTYFDSDKISRVTIELPRLRLISRFLAENNL